MIVGFTGPRNGLTFPQQHSLKLVLDRFPNATMHNGACSGGDRVARRLWWTVRPRRPIHFFPVDDEQYSYARKWDAVVTRRDDYLVRNREDIVNPCTVLVATPAGPKPEHGPLGGTWSTIVYAGKIGRPIVLVWPDGSVTEEGMMLENGWCASCQSWLLDGPGTRPDAHGHRIWNCPKCGAEEWGSPLPAQGVML